MPRHFRRRRNGGQRPVIVSYKKVLNFAPVSVGTAKQDFLLVDGKDSISSGQTSPTDANVPVGSRVTAIVIQLAITNLAATSMFTHISTQMLLSGQANTIAPNVVGGNSQRNQVFHQSLFSTGLNQNQNRQYIFKIPAKYQRVREDQKFLFTIISDATNAHTVQAIYKFYR